MTENLILVLMLTGLSSLVSFTAFLRLNLRHLRAVAGRSIFDPEVRREGGIHLDRERVVLSINALHAVWVGLLAIAIVVFCFSTERSMPEAIVQSIIGLGIVLILFDQLLPSIWMTYSKDPEASIRKFGSIIVFFYWTAYPFTLLIYAFFSIHSLFKPEENKEDSHQETILDFIEAGQEEGLIEKVEGEMIQSVVEFGDKTVREVMIPRHEINCLESNASLKDLRQIFLLTKHRRIIIFKGELDCIEGVVNIGDLLEMTPQEELKATLSSLITPIRFVPETKKVSKLLKELQQETLQMSLVVDEYGAIAGLVTIEDLVEEIVGEIRDEVEPHEGDITQETRDAFLVAGHTDIGQIGELLSINLESHDYTTVSGMIIFKLGRVPSSGESVEKNGFKFEVLKSSSRTVERVRVTKLKLMQKITPESDAL